MKKLIIITYITLATCMATATIVENMKGTPFAVEHIYGSWWFTTAWALLAASGTAYILKHKVRKPHIIMIHFSLAVILLGALTSHLFSHQGTAHLRLNEPTSTYITDEDGGKVRQLAFTLTLDTFNIVYHNGTDAVADYESKLTVTDNDGTRIRSTVSMNNTLLHRGIRFYQTSYDDDGRGSLLTVSNDAAGTAISYTGYAMLFISLLWMLIASGGNYRRLIKAMSECPEATKTMITALLLMLTTAASAGERDAGTVPKSTADQFGRLFILHDTRICPLQTFAIDFTRKLYGSSNYKGYSGEQVVMGFIFNGNKWCDEPIIHLKGSDMRKRLNLPEYVSVNTFFDHHGTGYVLGPYVREYLEGNDDNLHRQVCDVDDRIQMVMDLRRGNILKVFPYEKDEGITAWLPPTGLYSADVDSADATFMRDAFSLMACCIAGNDTKATEKIINAIASYQKKNGEKSLPSSLQVKAERLYNAIPFATILFIINILAGITAVVMMMIMRRKQRLTAQLCICVLSLSWAALTMCLAMRWIVSGTVPMTNGYETMILLAWMVTATALIAGRRTAMLYPAVLMMSAFFLLVAHMGMMNPQITHVMPVLNSPLLCIHVSIIMMSFALLSMTFIVSIMALACPKEAERLHIMNLLMLYPAMALLSIGIFTGAIWANISWGAYWSWDPKEVWALITLMVYVPALHSKMLPIMEKQRFFNIYVIVAFITILMTYFGCNYLLGGMHSYA